MNSSRPTRSPRPAMTAGAANSERLSLTRHAYSRGAGIFERMEATRAPSCQEGIVGALADHVVSEEHPAEKERTMRADRTET